LVILDITCPIRDTSTINPTHITMVGWFGGNTLWFAQEGVRIGVNIR
jgi:hypothetical protein